MHIDRRRCTFVDLDLRGRDRTHSPVEPVSRRKRGADRNLESWLSRRSELLDEPTIERLGTAVPAKFRSDCDAEQFRIGKARRNPLPASIAQDVHDAADSTGSKERRQERERQCHRTPEHAAIDRPHSPSPGNKADHLVFVQLDKQETSLPLIDGLVHQGQKPRAERRQKSLAQVVDVKLRNLPVEVRRLHA